MKAFVLAMLRIKDEDTVTSCCVEFDNWPPKIKEIREKEQQIAEKTGATQAMILNWKRLKREIKGVDRSKDELEEVQGNKFELPDEPIKVAEMLIHATEQCECNSIQRAFGAGEYYTCEIYSKSDLKQIAEHLLVHCNNQEQNGLMPADL